MPVDRRARHAIFLLAATIVAAAWSARAEDNPYREEGWAKFPDGRK